MVERHRALIVGAGPSGLATAACLRRAGIQPVLIERADSVGSTWRRHYERLHLHTYRDVSHLPYRRFKLGVPIYPSRQDVVDYLEDYARTFDLHPRLGEEVTSVTRDEQGWRVETSRSAHHTSSLVIATGYNRVPRTPRWPGIERFGGAVLHSSEYQTGTAWRGKRALVVGAGNSGAEIALDLFERGARPSIAIRSPIHVLPRDLLGIIPTPLSGMLLSRLPSRLADRLALPLLQYQVGDLRPLGIRRPKVGPITQVTVEGRIPLIDVGTIALIRQGHLRVLGAIERFEEGHVVFVDGRREPFDVVVLATGYAAALEAFFEGARRLIDERGYPRFHGEEVPGHRGLYFVGFRNPPIGALNDIRAEARRVAASIAKQR